jgi:hypothetical protein
MGEIEDLADDPLWWMFHATLWEGEFEDDVRGDEMADKEDGEFRTWLKLWRGFPGALIKGWAVIIAAVLLWTILR